jgi:hypothetical protein
LGLGIVGCSIPNVALTIRHSSILMICSTDSDSMSLVSAAYLIESKPVLSNAPYMYVYLNAFSILRTKWGNADMVDSIAGKASWAAK